MNLVFLHGFLGVVEDWDEILRYLDVPHRCITLPGHRGRTIEIESFEEEIGEGVTLIGYSMGGRLAMHYAKKYPKKVKDLILLSTNPGESDPMRMQRDETWARLLEEQGMEHFLEEWYRQSLFKGFKVDRSKRRHDPFMLAKALRRFSPARLPNLWPELKNFSFPMLFLFGENDIKYHLIGEKLQDHYPVRWIPNGGHPIHLENPKACAEYIKERL